MSQSKYKSREDWNTEVAESIRESEVVSLDTNDELIDSSSSLLIHSPFFNSDHIIGELDEDKHNSFNLTLMEHHSEEGDFTFQLRQSNYTFRPKIAGLDVIERILQDDSLGSIKAEDYNVSKRGIEIVSDKLSQPQLFDNLSTNAWKLYKTVRTPEGKYKFVFRQMGDKSEDELVERMSEQRIQRVIWDTRLNCVNCSEFNSVGFMPSSREDISRFTFQCENCEGEWGLLDRRPEDEIQSNQTREFIKFKVKQYYKTAVGSPSHFD